MEKKKKLIFSNDLRLRAYVLITTHQIHSQNNNNTSTRIASATSQTISACAVFLTKRVLSIGSHFGHESSLKLGERAGAIKDNGQWSLPSTRLYTTIHYRQSMIMFDTRWTRKHVTCTQGSHVSAKLTHNSRCSHSQKHVPAINKYIHI